MSELNSLYEAVEFMLKESGLLKREAELSSDVMAASLRSHTKQIVSAIIAANPLPDDSRADDAGRLREALAIEAKSYRFCSRGTNTWALQTIATAYRKSQARVKEMENALRTCELVLADQIDKAGFATGRVALFSRTIEKVRAALPSAGEECECQFCPCEKDSRCSICKGTGKQVCAFHSEPTPPQPGQEER